MKKLLVFLSFICLLFAIPTRAEARAKSGAAKCANFCYQCKTWCVSSDNKKVCDESCYMLKRKCCIDYEYGPGPKTTCACT